MLLMFPYVVLADGVDRFLINATLMQNGDLVVEEYFEVDGEYNGYDRDLYYTNSKNYHFDINNVVYGPSDLYDGSGINLIEVRALDKDENFNFESIGGKKFKKDNYADVGDYGVYKLTNNTDGISVRIFNPSRKNKAFYFAIIIS